MKVETQDELMMVRIKVDTKINDSGELRKKYRRVKADLMLVTSVFDGIKRMRELQLLGEPQLKELETKVRLRVYELNNKIDKIEDDGIVHY